MKILETYYPGKEFPSISLTGTYCSLNCKHCSRHYLEGMIPAVNEVALYNTARKIYEFGGKGFLLSGGSDLNGKLPLKKFKDAVKKIKKDFPLIINAHTGILEEDDIKILDEMSIDNISFDAVISDEIIKNVFGLNKTSEFYKKSLELLDRSGISYTPHIIIGLNFGNISYEYDTINFLKNLNSFKKLIFLILIPTKGTPMENIKLPHVDEMANVLSYSINNIKKEHVIGCMRPRALKDFEIRAIDLGVKGITIPAPSTIEYASKNNYEIVKKNICCAF
ncbi:MAG: radical SAM protein [Thermoplasmata archaeon]